MFLFSTRIKQDDKLKPTVPTLPVLSGMKAAVVGPTLQDVKNMSTADLENLIIQATEVLNYRKFKNAQMTSDALALQSLNLNPTSV